MTNALVVQIAAPDIVVFNFEITNDPLVKFTWSEVAQRTKKNGNLLPNLGIAQYEILKAGTSIKTVDGTTFLTEANWLGDKDFQVRALDVLGNAGPANTQTITIVAPIAPASFTADVIDNQVTLEWTNPKQTLPINHYILKEGGTSWSDATLKGKTSGDATKTIVIENTAKSATYRIKAVDHAGNEGAEAIVLADVNSPPDYVKFAENVEKLADLTGTRTNMTAPLGHPYTVVSGPTNTSHTWSDHFNILQSGGSPIHTTLQSFINAGFEEYLSPGETTCSYESAVTDHGSNLTAVEIKMHTFMVVKAGSLSIVPKILVSADNSNWTTYTGDAVTKTSGMQFLTYSVFVVSAFRYYKVRYEFTGAGNDDLVQIWEAHQEILTKEKTLGNKSAVSTTERDGSPGGDLVALSFKNLTTATITPSGTTFAKANGSTVGAATGQYEEYTTGGNLYLRVHLYAVDDGAKVSGNYSWLARGV